jgi:hypothetical protein
MSKVALGLLTAGFFLVLLFFPGSTQATIIQFTETDLNDALGPGGDLWQYSYVVSDFTFPLNFGFSVFFTPNLYSNLEDPPPAVNADWDSITLQPDSALPDAGLYDALALIDNASLADPFTVRFVWLGEPGTTPGTQPFAINTFNAEGNFLSVTETGQTQAPAVVPEPDTLVLLSIGLLGLVGRRLAIKNNTPPKG